MGLFDAFDITATGLSAERLRMDVTAENLANAQTTGPNGTAYRRKEVVLRQGDGPSTTSQAGFANLLAGALAPAQGGRGVRVAGIVEDSSAPRRVYDPGHPDADAQGYVAMPNVNPVTEMVDLISASRAYEADVTAMQTAKQTFSRTIDILR
jgi:flagellar basal-body rod protein FlgC